MDISGIPDLLQICQNDFNKTLYGIEKFVKGVLNGNNPHSKLKISEKIQQLNQLCHFSRKQETISILSETDVSGSIPNEIWMKVIGYLKCKDVFLGFGLVCKRFNDLTNDPMAIKSFELNRSYNCFNRNKIYGILRHSKSLKRIVLNSRNAPYNLLIKEALISNPQLKSVTLCYTWPKVSCREIVECLTKAKNIEHLEIQNHQNHYNRFDGHLFDEESDFTDEESYDSLHNSLFLPMKITDMKTLKTLRLNVKEEIRADFLQKLSVNCNNLETFELNNYSMDDPEGIQIAFDRFFKERKDSLKNFTLAPIIYESI